MLRRLVRRLLPPAVRLWWQRGERVAMGDLRALEPPSRAMGLDRGLPVDRWYIERFLAEHAPQIRGRVLEVADREYTTRFGGDRVTRSDVLHAVPGNGAATIVGDLATGAGIPPNSFDAMILSQVLQFIYDIGGAVRSTHAALARGGVVLATMSVIGPISRYDADRWGEYWRPTEQAARRLFEDVFGAGAVVTQSHGSHVTAHAYLAGMAAEELTAQELAASDPDYPVVITVVATKR